MSAAILCLPWACVSGIMNKGGMCGKNIHCVPAATSFSSPLVKSELAWPCLEELKFESPPPPPTPSLAGAATSIIFVMTKVSLRQTCVCCDKHTFVTTKDVFCHKNICRDKHSFVVTKVVMTKHIFCRDKSILVVTNLCHFCHDKNDACGSSSQWPPPHPKSTSFV